MREANPKTEWEKVVSKHKKNQKGLPALSSMKTDVGNRELSDSVFNSSVSDMPSAAVDGGSFGESFDKSCKTDDKNVSIKHRKPIKKESLDDGFDMYLRTWL
jgi:hypothetical protein